MASPLLCRYSAVGGEENTKKRSEVEDSIEATLRTKNFAAAVASRRKRTAHRGLVPKSFEISCGVSWRL